jgi:hypothetical protein
MLSSNDGMPCAKVGMHYALLEMLHAFVGLLCSSASAGHGRAQRLYAFLAMLRPFLAMLCLFPGTLHPFFGTLCPFPGMLCLF